MINRRAKLTRGEVQFGATSFAFTDTGIDAATKSDDGDGERGHRRLPAAPRLRGHSAPGRHRRRMNMYTVVAIVAD